MRIFVAMSGDIVFLPDIFLSSSIFPVLFPFNGGNGVYSVVECHKYVLFLLKWNFSPYVDSNVRYIETFENRSDTLHMRHTGILDIIRSSFHFFFIIQNACCSH